MSVNTYIKTKQNGLEHDWERVVPRLVCKDGFSMSVQASSYHYCSPREDNAFNYMSVEVGYPTERVEELMEYAEDPADPLGTVYGWVPVEVVNKVINQHGGIDDE